MKKMIYIAIALLCIACTTKPVDESTLFLTADQANEIIAQGELLTINDFLDRYMTEKGNYLSNTTQYRSRATADNVNYLFSIDTISKAERPVYIRGRITTDDYAGNFYKSLCIQQIVEDKQQALRISIDAGSVGGLYQIGQEILIRVDGLAIGRYANQPQLCVPSYNDNISAYNAEQKVGWAAGRIPTAIFKAHVYCIGKPDVSKLVYTELTIDQFITITNMQETRSWDGMLVRINDVHFTGEYFQTSGSTSNCTTGDPEEDSNANVFAPTTENVGYPQGRIIADNNGNKTAVSTSEYAKFAYYYLPGADANGVTNCSNYSGTIVGILGFYHDNANYDLAGKDWAISLRSLNDIQIQDINGNAWIPVEYSK